MTLPSGVISFWPVDEGTGNTLNDTENGRDGNIQGPTWGGSNSFYRDVYLIFGGFEYVDVGPNTAFNFGTSSYSLGVTVRSDGNNGIFMHKAGGGGGGHADGWAFGFQIGGGGGEGNDGEIVLNGRDDDSGNTRARATSSSYNDGNIYRVIFTDDGNLGQTDGMTCYINGSEVSTYEANMDGSGPDELGSSTSLQFGGQNNENQQFFEGGLDAFVIYDHELSPSEVQQDYNEIEFEASVPSAPQNLDATNA